MTLIVAVVYPSRCIVMLFSPLASDLLTLEQLHSLCSVTSARKVFPVSLPQKYSCRPKFLLPVVDEWYLARVSLQCCLGFSPNLSRGRHLFNPKLLFGLAFEKLYVMTELISRHYADLMNSGVIPSAPHIPLPLNICNSSKITNSSTKSCTITRC